MNFKNITNILNLIPIIKLELFYKEPCFIVKTNLSNKILFILKNHFKYQFKLLTCVSGVDKPKNLYRFNVVYELLSIQFNTRLRIKFFVDELVPIDSAEQIYPNASWWECEIWDMFGIFFTKHPNLVRLLTDYGFEGYPLRKDFPLTGFYESRYNQMKNRIVHSKLELCQEYRTFEFQTNWENFK